MFGNGRIFVSHTHEDNARCEPLLAALDAWQVDYWFDVAQLAAGQEFPDRIQQAIRERDILLRVCTPAANRSQWMGRELAMVRELRAKGSRRRLIVNLVLASGYDVTAGDADVVAIDATTQPSAVWLRALRQALGIPTRARRISRRAVVGLGVTSAAALAATAYAGKLLLFPDHTPPRYVPDVRAATPAAQTGAAHLRWTYRYEFEDVQTTMTASGDALYCLIAFVARETPVAFCLAAADGTPRWKTPVQSNSYAAPAVAGDSLYAIGYDGSAGGTFMLALSTADGAVRWRALLETAAQDVTATYYTSTITWAGDRVLARYKSNVVAVDAAGGQILWWAPPTINDQFLVDYDAFPAPVVANGLAYVGMEDGTIQVLDLTTGALVTTFAVSQAHARITATPTLANGLLYVTAEDGYCYAFDVASGALRWQQALTTALPDLSLGGDLFVASTPVVAGGVVYVGGGANSGMVSVNNTPTSTPTGSATGTPTSTPSGTPTPASGSSVLGDNLLALDAATGKILWSVHPSEHVFADESDLARRAIQSTPLVTADTVYVTGAQTRRQVAYDVLYALNRQDGSVRWSYRVHGSGSFPSAPAMLSGLVYWASSATSIYAMTP